MRAIVSPRKLRNLFTRSSHQAAVNHTSAQRPAPRRDGPHAVNVGGAPAHLYVGASHSLQWLEARAGGAKENGSPSGGPGGLSCWPWLCALCAPGSQGETLSHCPYPGAGRAPLSHPTPQGPAAEMLKQGAGTLELRREPRSEPSTGLNWSLISRQERGKIQRADHGERVKGVRKGKGGQGGGDGGSEGQVHGRRCPACPPGGDPTLPWMVPTSAQDTQRPAPPACQASGGRTPQCGGLPASSPPLSAPGSAQTLGSSPCPHPPPQTWLQGSALLLLTYILFTWACLLQGASQDTFYLFSLLL